MSDPRNDPPSPCIQVCTLDARGEFCLGCLRTLAEIEAWGSLGAVAKRALLAELERRAVQALAEHS